MSAPPDDPTARVIATGKSRVTGKDFAIAVAFEPQTGINGPAVAQSTFHHFADYNWDPARGAPTFVTEPAGDGLARSAEARRCDTVNMSPTSPRWLATSGGRPSATICSTRRLKSTSFPASDPTAVS